MTLKTLAKQLATSPKTLERESSLAYLEKKLHVIESEILALALKYEIDSPQTFIKRVKQGKITETTNSLDDFFALDLLENDRQQSRRWIK